jgi:hypothetical protein
MHTAAPVDLQLTPYDDAVAKRSLLRRQSLLAIAVGIDILFDLPLPRRIASRPVLCIASTIAEGAALPSIDTSWSSRLAVTFFIPALVNELSKTIARSPYH